MKEQKKLTGIVLAGGKSSRFGKDKAMANFGESTFLENAIRILTPITSDIIISSNHSRHKDFGFPVIEDEVKNIGPLGGILSALKASATDCNIILSVDMPLMNSSYIRYLHEKSKKACITVGSDSNENSHPTCGIYHKLILPYIEANIIKEKYSLHHLIKTTPHCQIISAPTKAFFYSDEIFHNINTISDYLKYISTRDNPAS